MPPTSGIVVATHQDPASVHVGFFLSGVWRRSLDPISGMASRFCMPWPMIRNWLSLPLVFHRFLKNSPGKCSREHSETAPIGAVTDTPFFRSGLSELRGFRGQNRAERSYPFRRASVPGNTCACSQGNYRMAGSLMRTTGDQMRQRCRVRRRNAVVAGDRIVLAESVQRCTFIGGRRARPPRQSSGGVATRTDQVADRQRCRSAS